MRFPLYWKQVENEKRTVSARGWSDRSLEEAQRNAEQRLARILTALQSNRVDTLRRDYQYVIDNNICEFVVERIHDSAGHEIAVISRNAYGSLILNTPKLMMVDIDTDPQPQKPTGLFGKLFGNRNREPRSQEDELERLRHWQLEHADYSLRVYRTAAGLRAIVPNRDIDAIDEHLLQLMIEMGSDPLYRELCRSQKCFRARLMPKPWRVAIDYPPRKFPFASEQDELEFNAWFERYLIACRGYNVCQLITTLGSRETTPVSEQLIELHDRFCCGDAGFKLA
ncbi:MAG TPA: hypothetical protein PKD64_16280 [Pirellulaceae bacterium]|nr:hypothetical protein [Pirellulaceae bacterium]HMO93747.1 hypothetical protein [Pirellulaceae bacterium]HMP69916.1 hypothetical protein [Pirellulaceae bacterium]